MIAVVVPAHIHAANLGVGATAYRRAGGFQPLDGSEDVALVKALQIVGARVAWSAAPPVISSAWRKFHGPDDVAITARPIDPSRRGGAGRERVGTKLRRP